MFCLCKSVYIGPDGKGRGGGGGGWRYHRATERSSCHLNSSNLKHPGSWRGLVLDSYYYSSPNQLKQGSWEPSGPSPNPDTHLTSWGWTPGCFSVLLLLLFAASCVRTTWEWRTKQRVRVGNLIVCSSVAQLETWLFNPNDPPAHFMAHRYYIPTYTSAAGAGRAIGSSVSKLVEK